MDIVKLAWLAYNPCRSHNLKYISKGYNKIYYIYIFFFYILFLLVFIIYTYRVSRVLTRSSLFLIRAISQQQGHVLCNG